MSCVYHFFLEAESSDSSEQQNSSVLATLAALAEATAPNTAQQSKFDKENIMFMLTNLKCPKTTVTNK